MIKVWPDKDPDEVLDYSVEWAERLPIEDDITTSDWFLDTTDGNLVIDSVQRMGTLCTVWLSGGTLGYTYFITNRVSTADGRTMDQTVRLFIRKR